MNTAVETPQDDGAKPTVMGPAYGQLAVDGLWRNADGIFVAAEGA